MTETQDRTREQPSSLAETRASERANFVTVIAPAVRWPRLDLGELWRFRELLAIFIWRDLKVRYKQTSIGAAWALFQPVFTAVVYTLVFGKFAKFPSGNLPYPVFAFAGVLAMQYFSSALSTASASVVANVPLVTKVYFPRLVGMIAWFHTWPTWVVVFAPLFILLALVTALGAALALSALNTRYRDVPYVIPLFMSVLPFLSGVPYSLDGAPEKWQWLLSLNPVTGVVAGWRWAVLDGPEPVLGQMAVIAGVALLVFAAGLAYFRRSEPRFADTI